MGGFSQGSSTSLAYAIRNPGRAVGVFIFSGMLSNHPSVIDNLASARDLPVFWGHGTLDHVIEFQIAEQGRRSLRDAVCETDHGRLPDGARDRCGRTPRRSCRSTTCSRNRAVPGTWANPDPPGLKPQAE